MIAVIIPVYCSSFSLVQVLQRAFASIPEDFKVYWVDDNSPIKTTEFGEKAHKYIAKRKNDGFTKTVNEGIKAALEDGAEVFVIMNQDVELNSDFCAYVRNLEGNERIIWSPKTKDEGAGTNFGSIWVTTKEVFEEIGFLDERLLHYFSDTEFKSRAKKKKVAILKDKNIYLNHVGGSAYSKLSNRDLLYAQDAATYRNLD